MLASNPSTTISQLTAIFNANNEITSWVHALENAVLPILDPQPSWYDEINAALKSSQTNSMSWLTTTSPQVHAGVSQSFIDYSNLFQTMAPNLKELVASIAKQGNIPTAQQQQDLVIYVTELLKQATTSQQSVQGLLQAITAYRAQMGSDHNALTTALNKAVAQEDEDRILIEQVQQQITAILQKLSADSTKANDSEMNYGTGVFSVIGGFTFGLVVAGGVLALGGFAIAILSVGAAVLFNQLYNNDVKEDLEQLTKLMSQLADDKQQLAMVQGVVTNLQSLLDSNDDALQTFASFANVWDWTVYGLNELLVVLAQPQIDVSKIPDLNDLDAAAAAWQKIATFAEKVQNATLQQAEPIQFPQIQTTAPQLRLVSKGESA